MNKWPIIVVVTGALAAQEVKHQRMELPTNQATPVLSPGLLETVRIVDADHTHKEPSSVDRPIGYEGTMGSGSTSGPPPIGRSREILYTILESWRNVDHAVRPIMNRSRVPV
jgi:hypothetical protein